MKNLLEFIDSPYALLEKKDGLTKIMVTWQKADVPNSNGRIYPKAVLQKEINRLQDSIAQKKVLGASFHPTRPEADDISHRWDAIWMEQDGSCRGEISILPTTKGKNLESLLKHATLGISRRGFGTTTKTTRTIDGKTKEVEVVNDDFKLSSPGDVVINPSVSGTDVTLAESVRRLEENLNKDIKEAQEDNMTDKEKNEKIKKLWTEARVAGFRGTFQEWKEKIYPLMEQIMTHRSELVQQIEERALAELKKNGQPRERRLYEEARQGGYNKSFETWKAEILPLLEDTKGEEKAKQKLYGLARGAGYKGSYQEWSKEIYSVLKEKTSEGDKAGYLRKIGIEEVGLSGDKLERFIESQMKEFKEEK